MCFVRFWIIPAKQGVAAVSNFFSIFAHVVFISDNPPRLICDLHCKKISSSAPDFILPSLSRHRQFIKDFVDDRFAGVFLGVSSLKIEISLRFADGYFLRSP